MTMIAQLWLALSFLLAQPIPAPVTITERVTQLVFVPIELRYFRDGDEIREYLADRPVSMPTEDQDCDDLARIFTFNARRKGLDVFPQYLSAHDAAPYGFTKEHMLVMALTESNAIYYIEPTTNQLWWVSPID